MNLIIIPTYNEKANLQDLLPLIYQNLPGTHILIVDDNSPDGTGDLVDSLAAATYPGQLFILKRPGKMGLGTAYLAGFKWALANNYSLIFEMDADFSHNPCYLPAFVEAAKSADLVIGSRYVAGGGVRNWGLLRRCISLGGSLYSRLIMGMPFHDLTGGFKCFRRQLLEQIDLNDVKSNGYSFQIEMTFRAYLLGSKIQEIPILFEERAEGQSKMSGSIFREAMLMVPKLRLAKSRLKSSNHALPLERRG
jgi:dolichol-phosphate mannosyltransferase